MFSSGGCGVVSLSKDRRNGGSRHHKLVRRREAPIARDRRNGGSARGVKACRFFGIKTSQKIFTH